MCQPYPPQSFFSKRPKDAHYWKFKHKYLLWNPTFFKTFSIYNTHLYDIAFTHWSLIFYFSMRILFYEDYEVFDYHYHCLCKCIWLARIWLYLVSKYLVHVRWYRFFASKLALPYDFLNSNYVFTILYYFTCNFLIKYLQWLCTWWTFSTPMCNTKEPWSILENMFLWRSFSTRFEVQSLYQLNYFQNITNTCHYKTQQNERDFPVGTGHLAYHTCMLKRINYPIALVSRSSSFCCHSEDHHSQAAAFSSERKT